MKPILLATHNPGKIKELSQLLSPLSCHSLSEFNLSAPAETGLTFVENALIKARYASQQTGLRALADDSGLVIPALNGKPGIYSARFAHDHATDLENLNYLRECLHPLRSSIIHGYFYCAIVYLEFPEDPTPIIATGTLYGHLHLTPKGDQGFGYDPLFYYPPLKKTLAELSLEEKNTVSHRALALKHFLKQFNFV